MTTTSNSNSKIIKVVLGDDMRRLVLNSISYDHLCKQITETFQSKIKSQSFAVKYKDEEEEFITMTSDAELAQAIEMSNGKTLKLYVFNPTSDSKPSLSTPSIPSTPILTFSPSTPISTIKEEKKEKKEEKKEEKKDEKKEEQKPNEEKKDDKKKTEKCELLNLLAAAIQDPNIQKDIPQLVDSVFNALLANTNIPTTDLINLVINNPIVTRHESLQKLVALVPIQLVSTQLDFYRSFVPLTVEKLNIWKPCVQHLCSQLPQISGMVQRWAEGVGNGEDIDLEFDVHMGNEGCCPPDSNNPNCVYACSQSKSQSGEEKKSSTQSQPSNADVTSALHDGVSCDVCRMFPIRGMRYKCCVCPNFDLCEKCESSNTHNPNHPMLKIRPPVPDVQNEFHEGVACDECNQQPIKGIRYKCSVCANYDLCSTCEAKSAHAVNHPFIKIHPSHPSASASHRRSMRPMFGMGGMGGFCRRGGGFGRRCGRRMRGAKLGGGRTVILSKLLEQIQKFNSERFGSPQTVPTVAPTATPTSTPTATTTVPTATTTVPSAPVNQVVETKTTTVPTPAPVNEAPSSPTPKVDSLETKVNSPQPAVQQTQPIVQPQSPPKPQPKPQPQIQKDSKYFAQLTQLAEMGFNDINLNTYLLEINKGNVQAVCRWLVEREV